MVGSRAEAPRTATKIPVHPSTSLRGNPWELNIPKPFLKPGAFHLQQIQTISTVKLERRLGVLTNQEMDRVRSALRNRFGIRVAPQPFWHANDVMESCVMAALRDLVLEVQETAVVEGIARFYDQHETQWLPDAVADVLGQLRKLAPDPAGSRYQLSIELTPPLDPTEQPFWDVSCIKEGDPRPLRPRSVALGRMARSSRAAIVARQDDSGRDRRALRLGNDLLRFHPGKNRRVPCGIECSVKEID